MTDEEKKAIEKIKRFNQYNWEMNNLKGKEFAKPYFESLDTLLNLIEKQSKEIEELKEERKKYPIAMNDEQYKKVIELAQKDIKEELDRQINARIVNEEFIENNFISKDKIKAKIEELENDKNRNKTIFVQAILYSIEVLQSLLEKE